MNDVDTKNCLRQEGNNDDGEVFSFIRGIELGKVQS